ncbi:MAG: cytochrome c3 family protein, partial [Haliscomenobacter sp.]|nr:cytochrome c3 family protein [Haliscomenobacter sp.]
HNVYYPLTGAHASVAENCSTCHKTGNIKDTPTDCKGCHNADFNAAQNPNHSQLGLSTDCATCHTTNPRWKPSTFNHNVYYPLTGAHASVAENCSACHKTGNIKDTPTDCKGCHNADFNAAQNPNHSQLGLSTDCATCHTTNADWMPAKFLQHNAIFPITGAHTSLTCIQCHKNGNYSNTPNTCNGCHNAAFNAAQNPNHANNGFPTDCASCHTTNPGWRPSTFNHNNYYPLTGAHASTSCVACHINGVYKNTPTDCNACHNAAFNAAQNPNHASSGFSTDCASCHTTNPGWRPSTFNHNNYYPLTGAHSSTSCVACHVNGVYKNTPTDCNACHNAAFNAAQNPNHASGGFSTDCASCHTTNPGWRPSTFNHNNYYPLTGAHSSTSCVACHINGVYKNTPTDCNACHNAAFNAAVNPNHKMVGLSTDCASCHTTNPGWRPSSFKHTWPLQGAHAAIALNCTSCHNTGNASAAPTTCIGCHATDYNTATPNHASAGFPTNCTSCHSQNSWSPATWNHDAQYFPIYSGKHKGEWTNCNECHTSAGNFNVFNCLNCHKKAETDKDHKDENGYIYTSLACFSCHPDGSSDD